MFHNGRNTAQFILWVYSYLDTQNKPDPIIKELHTKLNLWFTFVESLLPICNESYLITVDIFWGILGFDLQEHWIEEFFIYVHKVNWYVHINKLKENMIISLYAENTFDKVQQPFMIKVHVLQLDLEVDWLPFSWGISAFVSMVAVQVFSIISNGWMVLLSPTSSLRMYCNLFCWS